MIEFCIGLVAIMVVVAGVIQLGRLGHERTRIMLDAREEADFFAFDTLYEPPDAPPAFISLLDHAADNRSYSKDDVAQAGHAGVMHDALIDRSLPDMLEAYIPDNPLSELDDAVAMIENFSFVRGASDSTRIRLLPIIRRLVYQQDYIEITEEVWTVWTSGL